jgi:hypothetical protein
MAKRLQIHIVTPPNGRPKLPPRKTQNKHTKELMDDSSAA